MSIDTTHPFHKVFTYIPGCINKPSSNSVQEDLQHKYDDYISKCPSYNAILYNSLLCINLIWSTFSLISFVPFPLFNLSYLMYICCCIFYCTINRHIGFNMSIYIAHLLLFSKIISYLQMYTFIISNWAVSSILLYQWDKILDTNINFKNKCVSILQFKSDTIDYHKIYKTPLFSYVFLESKYNISTYYSKGIHFIITYINTFYSNCEKHTKSNSSVCYDSDDDHELILRKHKNDAIKKAVSVAKAAANEANIIAKSVIDELSASATSNKKPSRVTQDFYDTASVLVPDTSPTEETKTKEVTPIVNKDAKGAKGAKDDSI